MLSRFYTTLFSHTQQDKKNTTIKKPATLFFSYSFIFDYAIQFLDVPSYIHFTACSRYTLSFKYARLRTMGLAVNNTFSKILIPVSAVMTDKQKETWPCPFYSRFMANSELKIAATDVKLNENTLLFAKRNRTDTHLQTATFQKADNESKSERIAFGNSAPLRIKNKMTVDIQAADNDTVLLLSNTSDFSNYILAYRESNASAFYFLKITNYISMAYNARVALSTNGNTAIFAYNEHDTHATNLHIFIFRIKDNKETVIPTNLIDKNDSPLITNIAISHDGSQALFAQGNGSIKLIDLDNLILLKLFETKKNEYITSLLMSDDNCYVLITFPNAIQYWDLSTGTDDNPKCLWEKDLLAQYNSINTLETATMSKDGKLGFFTINNKTLVRTEAWNLARGEFLETVTYHKFSKEEMKLNSKAIFGMHGNTFFKNSLSISNNRLAIANSPAALQLFKINRC